jgi:hypothetical protein
VLPVARLPGACAPGLPGGFVELLVPPAPTAPSLTLWLGTEEPEPWPVGGRVSPEVVSGFAAACGVPRVPEGPLDALCVQAAPLASRAIAATDKMVFICCSSEELLSRLGNARGTSAIRVMLRGATRSRSGQFFGY